MIRKIEIERFSFTSSKPLAILYGDETLGEQRRTPSSGGSAFVER
jgi:hypothetical protein